MGQIRHINGVYYIEFYARGLLYSQVAGTDLKEAQRLLDGVEAKIAAGEALTIVRHIELPDFFERFFEEAKNFYSPKSCQRYNAVIEDFNSYLKSHFSPLHQLAQITPAVIESYKIDLASKAKPKVINLTILLLRDVLEFGIKIGFINDNPTLHVRLMPWPKVHLRQHGRRYASVSQLLSRGTGLGKLSQLMRWGDVARAFYYANLIPLSREDVYN